jgi:hypothetical protein
MRLLENWAKFAGFSALLAVALAGGLTWVLPDFFPPNPTERSIAQCSQQQDQEPSGNSSGPNTSDQATTHKYECLVVAYTAQLATFTELLALVTAVLIGVGWYQGVQLKRSVDSAERSDKTLERAYLWPGFGLLIFDKDGDRIGIHLGICNTGRTAGVIKTVHYALMPERDFRDFENGKMITYKMFKDREDAIIPDPNVEVRSGVWHRLSEMPKVSWGWIEYVDVFGETQYQGWKHIVQPTGHTESLPGCYTYKPWEIKHREEPSNQEFLPTEYITRRFILPPSTTELERPFIAFVVTKTALKRRPLLWKEKERSLGVEIAEDEIEFTFANHGRLPALLLGREDRLRICEPGGLPPPLSWSDVKTPLPYGVIVAPQTQSTDTSRRAIPRSVFESERNQWNDLEQGRKDLILMGIVRYRNLIGTKTIYEMRSCAVFDPEAERFLIKGGEEYNCHKVIET